MLNAELMKILRCPHNTESTLREERNYLICACGVKFAVVDDIPNMILDEAQLPPGCASIQDLPCRSQSAATSAAKSPPAAAK